MDLNSVTFKNSSIKTEVLTVARIDHSLHCLGPGALDPQAPLVDPQAPQAEIQGRQLWSETMHRITGQF